MEHKDEDLVVVGRVGQVLWICQGGIGPRTVGGEVVREAFLEEVGKGPQLWKELAVLCVHACCSHLTPSSEPSLENAPSSTNERYTWAGSAGHGVQPLQEWLQELFSGERISGRLAAAGRPGRSSGSPWARPQLLCPTRLLALPAPPPSAPTTLCPSGWVLPPHSCAGPRPAHCLLSASPSLLSGAFSLCFASKSPKRQHLFGWTDTGPWAMLWSQATDSCPGSGLQVWSPQPWPESQVAWRCQPRVGQHSGTESPACVGGSFSGPLTSRIIAAIPGHWHPRVAWPPAETEVDPTRARPCRTLLLDTLHSGLGGSQVATALTRKL